MSALRDIWSGRGTPVAEQLLFLLGAVFILVHTIDDTRALGEVDLAPTIINGIAFAVAALYRLLPWPVVAVLGLFVAATRLVGGIGHISSLGDPSPGDWTGPFEALGAICVLIVVVGVARRQLTRTRSSR
jgi:hypothetical protein